MMRKRELEQLGVPGELHALAGRAIQAALAGGETRARLRKRLRRLTRDPERHQDDPDFGELARALAAGAPGVALRPGDALAPFQQWGRDLDRASIEQMQNACALPISVRGALMPDAHVGYGLPIGGVLATRGAVIPFAVGVDIACRVKLSVLDLPLDMLESGRGRLEGAIHAETRFGIGARFERRRAHSVMDRDWGVSPVTRQLKDKAWDQLGTSGSGNHFVEFGALEVTDAAAGLPPGRYLALLSHSGSRGAGAQVCAHYSRIARDLHRDLPDAMRHLAWLSLDAEAGQEYWRAMELMGEYAAANHACIHRHIAAHLGAAVLLGIENHHNFAWRETHDGETVIVHRKGATPAHDGALGIIPGTMATPGFVVRGKGSAAALDSAAHGAGRAMSRTQAKKTLRWREARGMLDDAGVTLLSAGLDEVPMVYKDIHAVMAAQSDLVAPLAAFHPRIVKMAPAGERPED